MNPQTPGATFVSELAHFGLLSITGNDALAFLHGQLSCDVKAMAPLSARYGSYNTPQGRVLASLLLIRAGTGFFAQLPRAIAASIQQRLTKYVLRSKVKVGDLTDDYTVLGVAGDAAEAPVKSAFGVVPEHPMQVAEVGEVLVVRLASDRFEITAPAANSATLKSTLTQAAPCMDPAAWERLDIEAGIPWIVRETQEQFVPQMLNLDAIGGVSFNKGCYPGQEIVARMHYLGRLKQRMYHARLAANDAPRPGDKLYSADFGDQACGSIVNSARAGEQYAVLAVIQLASAAAGDVRWRAPDGPRLKFLGLPYTL
jgi:folate-binding protein YgfZ